MADDSSFVRWGGEVCGLGPEIKAQGWEGLGWRARLGFYPPYRCFHAPEIVKVRNSSFLKLAKATKS